MQNFPVYSNMHRPCLALIWCVVIANGPIQAEEGQGPKPTAGQIEQFEKQVRPLLLEHCARCHGDDPNRLKAELDLTSKAGFLAGGETGPVVVPGKPDESLLIETVRYSGEIQMPPKGKLKDHEIAVLVDWVKNGAAWPDSPDNKPAVADAKPNGPLFTEEQKQFWAFQPVQDPPVPAVAQGNPQAIANPIDAFVLAKLEKEGLQPAPPADKRTLIRRATFDLTGLPPTIDEVDAFLADQSPEAFAKVVDRLLNSPAYGERWGRHWLDVARYADSNGLDENTAFANAWRYRDYVVNAFNQDKPYDQFIQEQIAGDLLPPSDDPAVQTERHTALGYLVLGPKLLAEPDKQKMMLDIADEQLDTIGKGLMGLTMGCARCHDHKFDPIPTRDYYSLLAIFSSTRTMQNLNTVAKAFERPLGGEENPEVVEARKKLAEAREAVKKLEQEFGKTPEMDKEKRHEIHLKAEKIRAEIKELEKVAVPPAFTLSVEEGSEAAYNTLPRNLHVQIRGNYVTPGEEAPPVFLRIIEGENPKPFVGTTPNTKDKAEKAKIRFGAVRESSGRLELANWLTDPNHPLTARVWVNRIWLHHFGQGIVRSPDNFGLLGERPTHPELLDWLAARLVENGWSTKAMHRLIMLSNSYQMGSAFNPQAAQRDPENQSLWHFPRRRLEAEAIRDAVLVVADNLDDRLGGTEFPHGNFEYVRNPKYDITRRSIYLPVIRNNVFPYFQTFDFPDPSTMIGQRSITVVAPQSLYMLNSPFVQKQAELFADRLQQAGDDAEKRIEMAYKIAYSREPSTEETSKMLGFIQKFSDSLAEAEPDAEKRNRLAWRAWCQTLMASSEFVFLN